MWLAGTRGSNAAATVEAEIYFSLDDRLRPTFDASDPASSVFSFANHRVRFHDLRDASEAPSLERECFTLQAHRSVVTDFADLGQQAVYRAELQELLRQLTGSSLVFLSPTLVLRSKRHRVYPDGVIADRVADVVHSDRTESSVWVETRWALEHHAIETPPEGRMVSYNVWRSLTPPPQDFPLALCDLRTVRSESLVRAVSKDNPASRGQAFEFYLSRYDPGQRWCYFSNLTRDEVLVFQQYDTAASQRSGCLHTAFRDPTCTTVGETRLSVEARAYVFFPS
jgi:hypothetical protein